MPRPAKRSSTQRTAVQLIADKYIREQNKRLGPIETPSKRELNFLAEHERLHEETRTDGRAFEWVTPRTYCEIAEMIRRDQQEADDIIAGRKPSKTDFLNKANFNQAMDLVIEDMLADAKGYIIPLDDGPSRVPIEVKRAAAELKLPRRQRRGKA